MIESKSSLKKLYQVTKWLFPEDPFLEKVKSEIPNAVIIPRGKSLFIKVKLLNLKNPNYTKLS